MLKNSLYKGVKKTDALVARGYMRLLRNERKALIVFLVHSLFKDQSEIAKGYVAPQQCITIALFRELIENLLDADYRFISHKDILQGLNSGGKYVLLTFDDGYVNNQRVLPVLNEFSIPAVFFISSNHILKNRAFWPDVLYRGRKKQGRSDRSIKAESASLKSLSHQGINEYLLNAFGPESLTPVGEIDRPFTPGELKVFASESPHVFIGNHTADHAILTNYDEKGIRDQVSGCQEALSTIAGNKPEAIAYPNGNYSQGVIDICREYGLQIGITLDAKKNYLPIRPGSKAAMRICRFIPDAYSPISKQCLAFRSDTNMIVENTLRSVKSRLKWFS